jgi:hypothetical protein
VEPYLSKSRQLEYAETTSFYVTLLGTTLLRRLITVAYYVIRSLLARIYNCRRYLKLGSKWDSVQLKYIIFSRIEIKINILHTTCVLCTRRSIVVAFVSNLYLKPMSCELFVNMEKNVTKSRFYNANTCE